MNRFLFVAFLTLACPIIALAADNDSTGPTIVHPPPGGSIQITAKITAKAAVFSATLHYRQSGEKKYRQVAMKLLPGMEGMYMGLIDLQILTGELEYWIEAYDEFGRGPTRHGTPDKPNRLTMRLVVHLSSK